MSTATEKFPVWWDISCGRRYKYWAVALLIAVAIHVAGLSLWKSVYKPAENATPEISAIHVRLGSGGDVASEVAVEGKSATGSGDPVSAYETRLSAWIGKHRFYPPEAKAGGITGTALLRIKVDRGGKLLAQSVETTSGAEILDRAAIEIARSATPMPPIPAEYPGDNEVEFLIPIIFK